MRARPSSAVCRRARYWPRALLREAPEIFEIPPWPLGWILVGALMLLAGKSLVTAGLAHLDPVVAVQGRVLAPASAVVVQPRETGVIKAVHARDGEAVRQNDVLLRIASPATSASIDRLHRERREASLAMLRLAAQLTGDPRALSAPADAEPELVERARWLLATRLQAEQARTVSLRHGIARDRARRAGIAAEFARGEALVSQIGRHIVVEQELVKRGLVSDARLDKVRTGFASAIRRQAELAGRIAELDQRIATWTEKLGGAAFEFDARTRAEHAAAAERFESATRALAQKNRELRDLRAPTDGIVQGVAALGTGNVVAAAQPLLRILPVDADIEVEARVPRRDIRWFVEGQRVTLRLATLETQGHVAGEVASIARDSVDDSRDGPVYAVRIRLARRSLSNEDFASTLAARGEASVVADIQFGARGIFDLVLHALLRQRFGGEVPAAG